MPMARIEFHLKLNLIYMNEKRMESSTFVGENHVYNDGDFYSEKGKIRPVYSWIAALAEKKLSFWIDNTYNCSA